ncbi:Chitin synthase, class 3 [Coemansia sp. RSA 988]|nr:Chitin synthase, class 3 [Coemansia sp. RSA 988]
MAAHDNFDDGFDGTGHGHQYGQSSQQQQQRQQPLVSDEFDGIFTGNTGREATGFFGLQDHGSGHNNNNNSGPGVELEVLSNTSSNTRNEQLRDRLDHRTGSDISSQAGAHPEQPLITPGGPLLSGIATVKPEPTPTAPPVDSGRHLHRRRRKQGDGADEPVGEYQSYEPPNRNRESARPAGAGADGLVRQRALSRGTGSRRPRVAASAPRNRRGKQKQAAGAALRRRCCSSPWLTYCRIVTFWAPGGVLKCFGMPAAPMQLAWREKMGLVSIILLIMGAVAFLTFGLQQLLCGLSGRETRIKWNEVGEGYAVVGGRAYDITHFKHGPATPWTGDSDANIMYDPANAGGKDLSFLFQNPNSACRNVLSYRSGADSRGNVVNVFPCVYYNGSGSINPNQIPDNQACHNSAKARNALNALENSPVEYSWPDVGDQDNMVVFNGAVLDMQRGQLLLDSVRVPSEMKDLIDGKMRGMDVSLYMSSGRMKDVGNCMADLFRVGSVDTSSMGCIAANIVMYVSLIVILGTVLARFSMAVYFGWFMGPRLGQVKTLTPDDRRNRMAEIEAWADDNNHYGKENLERKYTVMGAAGAYDSHGRGGNRKSRFFPTTSRYSHFMPGDEPGARDKARPASRHQPRPTSMMPRQSAFFSDHRASHYSSSQMVLAGGGLGPDETPSPAPGLDLNSMPVGPPGPPVPTVSPWDFDLAYTLLLVTCYSEGSHGIRTTLDSLCGTDYPASHKCLFIICDGLIKGAGEDLYTPDACLSMMCDFVIPPDRVQPYTYVSIAQGAKRHNMAKLYAGYYAPNENSPRHARENKVPMVLVVKCGTPEEVNEAKPGNRGKRDSQIILMSFLQRVMFDERMTELEYELFNAMWNITGVTPDNFEIVLMVDADTKVYVDSVTAMVKNMVDDPTVMGQCGETKISNKTDSWVTMIQVFEYYIAHHQSKAFESVFGGVTCLPGCFCMYRIKAPKGQHGYWVPILANPDIVEHYSENVVETLHDKNLLLLGEDRYLSTLMLRTFPKRKMMFIPSSVCKTVVPDEFKVLLSQRRRWINSTVHNLLELVLVNDLCGTFCLSMQFMIFMDLIGTLALPAAITFTLYIIIISTFTRPVPWLPLVLLGVILGLPAVLIGLTSRKLVYIGWMMIYLLSLPVWNFVLPVYAYWHFDDFSWGQTRMIQGEAKDKGHGAGDGEFDSTQIVMKRWCDFEAEKRRKTQAILGSVPSLAALAMSSSQKSVADLRSLNARQSRAGVSRPVSAANSGSSRAADSPQQLPQHTDSDGEHIPAMGQAAVLQQAAETAEDVDAQAAAGSIERLGYMTPNIIPMLATQNIQRRSMAGFAVPSSLSSPVGGGFGHASTSSSGLPLSPEHPAGFYIDPQGIDTNQVPTAPMLYGSPEPPRSQSSRGDSPPNDKRPAL